MYRIRFNLTIALPTTLRAPIDICFELHRRFDQWARRAGLADSERYGLSLIETGTEGNPVALFDVSTTTAEIALRCIEGAWLWQASSDEIALREIHALKPNYPALPIWNALEPDTPIEALPNISLEDFTIGKGENINAQNGDMTIHFHTPVVLDTYRRRELKLEPKPLTLGRIARNANRRMKDLGFRLEGYQEMEAEADRADRATPLLSTMLHDYRYISQSHVRAKSYPGWSGQVQWKAAPNSAIETLRAISWFGLGAHTRFGFGQIGISISPTVGSATAPER